MAVETNKFSVVKKKHLEKSQFRVECNVPTDVEIDKILSVCHSVGVENAEILNGSINFNGLIDVCILYSTVDGEIGTLNSSCPYSSKFEDETIKVGDKVWINVEIEECEVESVIASNVKLNCLCVQNAVLILNREVEFVSNGDDELCLKEDEMMIDMFVGEAKETFTVESEVSIKEPIKKLLLTDSQVAIKNVESGVNFVSVGGEVITRLLYLTEKDRFESCYVTENFKEEIELEGVARESVSEAVACVKKNLVKCEIDSTDKSVNIKLTIPVEVSVTSYMEKPVVVINDIYSTTCELEVSTESFDMTKTLPCETFEFKIDGTLTLDDDSPRVDKIMFVSGANLNVTNSYLNDGELVVEGVAKTNVVYLNDEANSLNSVTIEVPFVVSEKTSVESGVVSVNAIIYDVDVVVKKGREFYFDAKIKVVACFDQDEIGAVICNVNYSTEYPERDCAIELIFANAGQSAWDIGKAIKVSEQTIYLNNPDTVFPLEEDESIVVYYQKRD